MRILSQTNDIKGYHGTIGTPTNMYDYRGEQLFIGDVVCLVTFDVDGKKAYDFGIEFVCEENIDIANWTYKNRQYVMGIANIYNNENFKVLDGVELNTEEWGEKFDTIDSEFRVYKVKDHNDLAVGEKIGFLSVVDVSDRPTENGEVMTKHKHKVVRVDNLMYNGCEPHWKCTRCGMCVPFHCYTKEQFEGQDCKPDFADNYNIK